ncbi:Uncharacterised protein [Legionella gratiana]|uniref:Uncharacterized protein n=1 Tax=Legionella gratiana TaxID=45066 RepID=A0A378JF61_9GAMM|nr:Uncharacterised protein [Legionella gratiana]
MGYMQINIFETIIVNKSRNDVNLIYGFFAY